MPPFNLAQSSQHECLISDEKEEEKYLTEFEKLLQKIIPGNYFFPYQRDTINLWWWDGKDPMIDINCGDGNVYVFNNLSKIPLNILRASIKFLNERIKYEKAKRKIDQEDS